MLTRLIAIAESRQALAAAIVLVLALAGVGLQSFRSAQLQLDRMQHLISDTNLAQRHELDLSVAQLKLLLARADRQEPRDVKRNLTAMLGRISAQTERFTAQLERLDAPLRDVIPPGEVDALVGEGRDAVDRLQRIVAFGDAAVETEDGQLLDRLPQIDIEAGTIQSLLYSFFRRVNAVERTIMQRQSDLLSAQGASHAVILGIVVAISLSSLAVLRREMSARAARSEAEKKANFLAYYDSLTALPNRSQFQHFGEELLLEQRSVALILIDLDNFKEINDRHGHGMGDAVLREVGIRLHREAEENRGIAARLGGDEFAMLLPSDNTAFLQRHCQGLIEVLSDPVDYGGNSVNPGASIGLATASQLTRGSPPDLEMLTRFADFALYASKQQGRGRYTLYDSELDRRFSERREMLEDLPHAIRSGQLEVWFQPKVDMWNWETYGFEALVRWNRRGRIVVPGDFIEIAEEGGFIKAIDLRVLQDATRILSAWNDAHDSGYSLSVNVSALHLLDDDDTANLVQAIRSSALAVELLTIEITETVQLADWSRVSRAIATLRQTGCRISIDDFGTGYSSLAYLRTIPADELKIDKSLVAEIETSSESQFILDAVIDLARSLEMSVVVEGIERQSQVSHLCDIGCRKGQGFLFGRPEPAQKALDRAGRVDPGPVVVPATLDDGEDFWLNAATPAGAEGAGRPDRGRRRSRIPG